MGKLKAAVLATFALAALTSCQSSRAKREYHEGYVATDQQKIEFLVNELIPEKEVVVCVGECFSRELVAIQDQYEFLPADQRTKEVRDRHFIAEEKEREKPIQVKIFSSLLLLKDVKVVSNANAGFTTSAHLKTNSRFIHIRVEFPEDGDARDAIIDINKGWFVLISREGDWFDIHQFNKTPGFE